MSFFHELLEALSDLRYVRLFPRRMDPPQGMSEEFWSKATRRYRNTEKWIAGRSDHWYVIEYMDGRCELAYLRVLQGGLLSGKYPAIYRGLWPVMVTTGEYVHMRRICPAAF